MDANKFLKLSPEEGRQARLEFDFLPHLTTAKTKNPTEKAAKFLKLSPEEGKQAHLESDFAPHQAASNTENYTAEQAPKLRRLRHKSPFLDLKSKAIDDGAKPQFSQ